MGLQVLNGTIGARLHVAFPVRTLELRIPHLPYNLEGHNPVVLRFLVQLFQRHQSRGSLDVLVCHPGQCRECVSLNSATNIWRSHSRVPSAFTRCSRQYGRLQLIFRTIYPPLRELLL